jgi:hypothetical protein
MRPAARGVSRGGPKPIAISTKTSTVIAAAPASIAHQSQATSAATGPAGASVESGPSQPASSSGTGTGAQRFIL